MKILNLEKQEISPKKFIWVLTLIAKPEELLCHECKTQLGKKAKYPYYCINNQRFFCEECNLKYQIYCQRENNYRTQKSDEHEHFKVFLKFKDENQT